MARLEQVHRGDSAQVAIVFLHGLGGHLFDTWTGPGTSRDDCWLHWVGQDVDCDTWTLGYDAALSRWQDQAMPLPDQGTQIAQLLAVHPGLKDRDLVLVGHSMGGLIIKTLITQARAAGDTRTRALLDRIRGVVFVATPHQGSQLASLAMAFAAGVRTNAQVGNMSLHDAHLRQLGAAFREQRRELRLKVAAFAEGRDVVIRQRGLFGWLSEQVGVRVVDPSSSDPALDGINAVPLAEDHFSICKPVNRDAQIHHGLLAFIRDDVLAHLNAQQNLDLDQQVDAPRTPPVPSSPAPIQTPKPPTTASADSIRVAALAALQIGSMLELAIDHLRHFGLPILFASWENFADNETMAKNMFERLEPIDFELVSRLAPLGDQLGLKIINGFTQLTKARRLLEDSLPSGGVAGVIQRLPWTEERDVKFKTFLSAALDDLQAAAALCRDAVAAFRDNETVPR
jgi:pimeloyl-ACP methyl ester carboxylesterase